MALFRAFVGISLDGFVTDHISSALVPIKTADQEQAFRWVPERNWHVTLAFLGDQSEETLATLPERLTASLQEQAEFNVGLTRIDMFPDVRSRIIAAWVTTTPELGLLYQRIWHAADSLGIVKDAQAFLPHITLGRFRKGRSTVISSQAVNSVFRVRQITLFKSQRTPKGSIYTPLASLPLMKLP